MSHIKKSLTNGMMATVVVATFALIAAWQFYLFATFKDANGGTYHLLISIGMALLACVAGFFAFSVSVGYNEDNQMHINS